MTAGTPERSAGDVTQDELARPLTDSDKLRVLAAWFDMWDARDDVRRRSLLDDQNFPGKNDVQRDLRRIADALRDTPVADTAGIDAEKEYIADKLRRGDSPSLVMAEVRLREVVNGSPGSIVQVAHDDLRELLMAYRAAALLRTPKPEGEPE